jgi:hypothetical protein
MSSRREVVIKLTDEQRNEIRAEHDKEVIHVVFQIVGARKLIVDISDCHARLTLCLLLVCLLRYTHGWCLMVNESLIGRARYGL